MFSSKHPVARWNAAPSKDTPDVVTVILTQPPTKAGLQEWGTDAKQAVTSTALQKNLS